MNNPSKKKTILTVAGLLLLILACVAAVELIFLGLGEAIPNESRDSGQSVSVQPDQSAPGQAAPSFCPFCGEGLPSGFQWGQFCPFCGERVEP